MISLVIRDLFIFFFFLEFCDPCDKDWKKQLEFVIYLDIRDLFILFIYFFFLKFCDPFNMSKKSEETTRVCDTFRYS